MNAMTRRGLCLAAAALMTAGTAAPATAADAWSYGSRAGSVTLFYGETPPAGEPPNEETIQLSLSCRTGSGVVRILVGETSEKLKPGGTVRLTLAAAQVALTVPAKLLPNQLAGVPSLQATAPVGSAVFNVLARMGRAGRGALRLSAGAAWSGRFPLKTLGSRADRFVAACGPKAR